MEAVNCVRMNGSDHGVHSYANNSILQRTVISKTRPIMEQIIIKTMHLYESLSDQCFTMADLGCSSGSNTLLTMSYIIDVILGSCQSPPELQVFLNDLPTNDFNSVFLSLPEFYNRFSSFPCYVSGTPGSFYGRLFPNSTLHFVHSSYSLHWLSQVPRGIENNKENIYISSTSPQNVSREYKKQFQRDFSKFLSHRAKEIKVGGGMILSFIGKSDNPTCRDSCLVIELLSNSLLDMVKEGKIKESEVDSFNIPNYHPSKREVKEIVESEGSFSIDELSSFETNWDGSDVNEHHGFDKTKTGQNVANIMRAVLQSMIASHFGEHVIDDLFAKFAKRIGDHLSVENTKYFNIVISMTKM